MSSESKVKGHCPNCGGERFADVEASHKDEWSDGHVSGYIKHSILKCRGCEFVYIQKAESCSEDDNHYQDETGEWQVEYPEKMTYWPSPLRRKIPDWIYTYELDEQLVFLLYEMYAAINRGLPVLTAIGVRTVFDRASDLHGIESQKSFKDKLKMLREGGYVGVEEWEHLNTLVDAGSAAAHRGWRPSLDEIDVIVSTIESFLHRSFVLRGNLKQLKERVPLRGTSPASHRSGLEEA